MQGTEGHSLPDGIGCAVIERQPLETLRHLWDGPLEPLELERIEMSLRAIITGHTLVVARFHDVWDDLDVDDVVNGSGELAPVFSDFLDYEFISPDEPQPFRHPESSLEKQDESSLVESVCISLGEKAVSVLPKWISRRSEAFAFWDAWYRGEPRGECERSRSHCWKDRRAGGCL